MKCFIYILCLISACQALIDITVDQSISNAGFHKLIISNITIYGNLSSCFLAVEEKFPKNFVLFSNDIEEAGKHQINTKLSPKLDVEASASQSVPFSLYIFLNRSLPITTSNEFHSAFIYNILAHVRYHDPKKGGGYQEFKKDLPILYARCPEGSVLPPSTSIKFSCDSSSNELCNWHTLKVSYKNQLPQLQIPVGNTDLYQIIFLSTHVSAYVGFAYIVFTLLSMKIH